MPEQEFATTDVLRLEIEDTPTGLVNLVQNPSGEKGAWFWITPVANTVMTSDGTALTFTTTPSQAAYFTSDFMPVAATKYVASRIDITAITASHNVKIRYEWYDASRALLSSSIQSAALSAIGTSYGPVAQAPANTGYVKMRLDFYNGTGNPSAASAVTFTQAMVTWQDTGTVTSQRTNLVTNPSLETNTTGWAAVRQSEVLTRDSAFAYAGTYSLKIANNNYSSNFLDARTPTGISGFRVDGSTDYTYSAYLYSAQTGRFGYVRVHYYTSSGTEISNHISPGVALVNGGWTRASLTHTAPSNAYYAAVYVMYLYTSPIGATEATWVDAVMVEKGTSLGPYFDGSTSGAGYTYAWTGTAHASSSIETSTSSTFAYSEPDAWLNILAPAHDLKVTREALNVGILSATILDATLDPSQGALIRPGKRVRLTALEGDTWEPLFTGKVDKASVVYDLLADQEQKRARITLTAIDPVSTLAGTSRSQGVAGIAELPYVLEGCGVPWNVNGSGNQVPTATVVATNDNASALDQVAITRDSVLGYAWVDRHGVLQAWDSAQIAGTPVATLDEAAYNPDIEVDYNTEACINEVRIKYVRLNPATSETEEIPYGPYRDQTSIDTWGVRSAEFTIQGITEDTATLTAHAQAILDANATPVVRINSVTLPIAELGDIGQGRALLDLYDLVTVANARAGITENSRVTGIEHTITPDKWLTKVAFSVDGSVASPQATPSPSPGAGGQTLGQLLRPVGEVTMYGGATAPAGWLICDGSSKLVADYPDLHAAIGYTYGGAGLNFNLPDLRSRMPVGIGTFVTLGQNETGTPTSNDDATRTNRWDHTHSHGKGTLATAATGSLAGTATGSTDRPTAGHTHNVTGSTASASAVPSGTVHPVLGLNFIIRAY